MNRRNLMKGTALAALIALGTWGAIAMAAPMGARQARGMRMGHHDGMGRGPMGHLRQLGLSEAQRDRIEALHDAQRRSAIELRKDLELAELDLRKEMRADRPDRGAIESQIDRVAALRAGLQKSRVNTMLDVHEVLTPQQRQKLEQLRENGPGKRGERGERGDRGPGRRGETPPGEDS